MSTATGNYVCDNSSLTNFKSWAQAISGAFSTLGWTQTSDTGQVNWSTISAVPSSTYVYEVWKAADSAASTLPIYVKMEYGNSSTVVGIRITVGTGSNGSGTITGAISFNAVLLLSNESTVSNQGASATYPCYFSGNAGEFRMLLWVGNTSPGVCALFVIERSKDTTGAVTTSYFTTIRISSYASNNTGICRQQTTTSSLTVTTAETGGLMTFTPTSNNNTGLFGSNVAAFPVFPILGYVGNPMLGIMTAAASDVGDGSTVTVASMYGATHTFIACKNQNLSGFQRLSVGIGNGTSAVLTRYE